MKGDKLPEEAAKEVADVIESVPASPSKTTELLTKPVAPTVSVYQPIKYTAGMWGWLVGYKPTEEELAKDKEQFDAAEKAKQDAYQEALRAYQVAHPDEVIPELQPVEAGEQKQEGSAQTVAAANSKVATLAAVVSLAAQTSAPGSSSTVSSEQLENCDVPESARKRSKSR